MIKLARILRRARSEIETGGLLDCARSTREQRETGDQTCVCYALQRACEAFAADPRDCSETGAEVRDVMAEAAGSASLCGWQDVTNREETIMAFDRATELAEVRL